MLNQLAPLLKQSNKKGRKAKSRPIFVSKKTEVLYAKALLALVDEMHHATSDELPKLLTPQIGDSRQVVDGLFDRFSSGFHQFGQAIKEKTAQIAQEIAKKIVHEQKKASDEQLVALLKKQTNIDLTDLMKDEDLENAINEAIGANVALIKSIPEQYLAKVEQAVLAGLQAGTLNQTLADDLAKTYDLTQNRAKLIATDQLAKINSRLSQIRQQKLGITHYTWRTSLDERVRHDHRLRDGKLFAWDNPPPDGHAGQAIRCRCVAVPYTEHLFGGALPEAVMGGQKDEVDRIKMADEHLRQSYRLLHKKSSNGGLGASEFLSVLQTDKQGNPALRLSQDLYAKLQKKLGSVPPVWAVNHYTIHSKHINDLLRGRDVSPDFLESSKNAIALIDELFDSDLATVQTPFKLVRGHSLSPEQLETIKQGLSSDNPVSLGHDYYISTSLSQELAEDFAKRNAKKERLPVVYHLNVQQGAKAVDISPYHFYTNESEILLHKKSVFKVKSMTQRDDGVYEVKADVVLADKKSSVGDTAETPYGGKQVIYVEPVEDEDPYWNRWAGSGMTIIIG